MDGSKDINTETAPASAGYILGGTAVSGEALASSCTVAAFRVFAGVENNGLTIDNAPKLLGDFFRVFAHAADGAISTADTTAQAIELVPAVPIKKSITPDAIISLEDGKPYKSLKRHLSSRGMTPDQYRAKWGLPADYPLVAKSYSERRSALARETGLGIKTAATPIAAPAARQRKRA